MTTTQASTAESRAMLRDRRVALTEMRRVERWLICCPDDAARLVAERIAVLDGDAGTTTTDIHESGQSALSGVRERVRRRQRQAARLADPGLATILARDPRWPDSPGLVELTLEAWETRGGDVERLRDEAGQAGDTVLVEIIDAYMAR